jgi:hypothetical protein
MQIKNNATDGVCPIADEKALLNKKREIYQKHQAQFEKELENKIKELEDNWDEEIEAPYIQMIEIDDEQSDEIGREELTEDMFQVDEFTEEELPGIEEKPKPSQNNSLLSSLWGYFFKK